MAELTEIGATTPKKDADVDECFIPKLPNALYRNYDKSGDWKTDPDIAWCLNTRNDAGEVVNLKTENMMEWKYKNLYSMSEINGRQSPSWRANRAAAPMTGVLQNKTSDGSAIKEKSALVKFRDYLASYQESFGIPRTEYSFASLIKVMGQATGRSLFVLFHIIVNITPIAQILLHILRFVLDKIISIQNTNDSRQMIVKYAILGIQLLCVYVCLVFIFGFIAMPILHMTIGILAKIMLYD